MVTIRPQQQLFTVKHLYFIKKSTALLYDIYIKIYIYHSFPTHHSFQQ